MSVSISSLFITLCISMVLIIFLTVILTHKKSYSLFRADILFILVNIIILRLLIPFEFPFTITIPLPSIMNPLMNFLNYNVYHKTKIIHILSLIWLIGIIIGTYRYIQKIFSVKKIKNTIIRHSQCYKMSDLLKKTVCPDFNVLITSYVSSPMVLGFKKIILLPEIKFSQSELLNILNHESQHLRLHDILFKQIVYMLTIIYWWFPPIYLFKKNINFFLEVRADEKATASLDINGTLEYAETLIKVQKKISSNRNKIINNFSSYMIGENRNILSYRINYLINKQIKKKTNKILLCLIFLLPLISNLLIFEPYYSPSKQLDGTITDKQLLNESYLIKHKNGTYSLCIGKETFAIQNPDYFIKLGIDILKE